jgi:hypothetical protein
MFASSQRRASSAASSGQSLMPYNWGRTVQHLSKKAQTSCSTHLASHRTRAKSKGPTHAKKVQVQHPGAQPETLAAARKRATAHLFCEHNGRMLDLFHLIFACLIVLLCVCCVHMLDPFTQMLDLRPLGVWRVSVLSRAAKEATCLPFSPKTSYRPVQRPTRPRTWDLGH